MKLAQYVHLIAGAIATFGVPTLFSNWVHAHLTLYAILVGASLVLHAICPSIFGGPSDSDTKFTGLGLVVMALMLGTLALGQPAQAQTLPSNVFAAGVSYNNAASPSVSGTGLYAHLAADSGTYVFTVADALPTSLKPFTVTTNLGAGIAQKIFAIGKVPFFIPTSAGISLSGNNTGWAWTTGVMASIKVKNKFYVMPMVRTVKSSVSGGSGYQPIVGVLFGFGE